MPVPHSGQGLELSVLRMLALLQGGPGHPRPALLGPHRTRQVFKSTPITKADITPSVPRPSHAVTHPPFWGTMRPLLSTICK